MTTTQRDEGGFFGVIGHEAGVSLAKAAAGLLKGHGRWARGIAVVDDGVVRTRSHRTTNVFRLDNWVESLTVGGKNAISVAIGHPLLGDKTQKTPQEPVSPFVATIDGTNIAVGMVGGFLNGAQIRTDLQRLGALFSTILHAELLMHLIARSSKHSLLNRLVDALWQVDGGYAIVLMFDETIIAVRDPSGLRPLYLGEINGAAVVSTSSGVLVSLRATSVRLVEAGELLVINGGQVNRVRPFLERPALGCPMELLEIEGLNGVSYGRPVYPQRLALAAALAAAFENTVDLVVGLAVADTTLAVAFSDELDVPYKPVLHSRYHRHGEDGRVFEALVGAVKGKRVALMVSGLFTGESVTVGVAALRETGATEVHVVCTTPPRRERCNFGVSGPERGLIGENHAGFEGVRDAIGAKSVMWLSTDQLASVLGGGQWCWHCINGQSPIGDSTANQLGLFNEESTD